MAGFYVGWSRGEAQKDANGEVEGDATDIGGVADNEEDDVAGMGDDEGGVSEAGIMINKGLGLGGGPIEDDEGVASREWVGSPRLAHDAVEVGKEGGVVKAKDLIEGLPKKFKEAMTEEEVKEAKKQLEQLEVNVSII
uniref:Uncharacterized protein LOC105049706 n=1 Tax=Elaeis guineensis var. tenera TaxID=51953 RepID=A0A6I9RJF2_ELAGV|nr:uncharacterized protein LOC105049706 [Elaeis guineensis]